MSTGVTLSGDFGKFNSIIKKNSKALKNNRAFKRTLEAVGDGIRREAVLRFDKEVDPTGRAWKPLADSTKDARRRGKRFTGKIKILQDTGDLKNRIIRQVSGLNIEVGSALDYANKHQFGGGNIPKRPFIGITSRDRDLAESLIGDFLNKALHK